MLAQSGRAAEQMTGLLTVVFLAVGLCGAGGGLLGGWVIATGVRRVMMRTEDRLRVTAVRLSAVVPGARTAGDAAERLDESVSALLDRFRQIERDALRAEQLAWVGQMAAGIAHEVRNPLTVIKLLVQAATDPKRAVGFRPRDLRVLEGEILRLEQIISAFLDFARPPRPAKKTVATCELLDECLAGVAARAELQRVDVRLDAPPELPPLDADPGQIKQVIYNLMFNALDVLTAGGTVRVGVTASGGPGREELTIGISDSGPGLPAGLENRLFDPFVSTKETGLGLGLSICKRIVEAHGGSITATNSPAGGAIFVVRLPCAVLATADNRRHSPQGVA